MTAGTALPPESEARRIAGNVLRMSTRNPRTALTQVTRALERPELRGSADRAYLERALGHALRAVGDYRASRLAYLRARRAFRRAGYPVEHAICALGLVDACMYLGLTREAEQAAGEARRVFRKKGDNIRLARLETNVGNLHHRIDSLDLALRHYDLAAGLFDREGSALDRARLDFNRANVMTFLGRTSEAEVLYLEARRTLAAAGENVLAAQVNYGLACLRFLTGEYVAAMAGMEIVRPQLIHLGARQLLPLADLDLAEVLLALRLHPEALSLARSAGGWFRRRGVPAEYARCRLVAGSALASLGQLQKAKAALIEADRIFIAQKNGAGRGAVALVRGQLAWKAKRWSEAAQYGFKAQDRFIRAQFEVRGLAAGALACEALLAGGNTARALRVSRRLLSAERRAGDAYSRARLGRVAGAASLQMSDRKAAERYYREAIAETDRAPSSFFVDEWRVGFMDGEPLILDEFLGVVMSRRKPPDPREIWHWVARQPGPDPDRKISPLKPGPAVTEAVARLRSDLETCYAGLWKTENGGSRKVEAGTRKLLERRAGSIELRLRRLASTSPAGGLSGSPDPPAVESRDQVHVVYFSVSGRLSALRIDSSGWSLRPDLVTIQELNDRVALLHYQLNLRAGESALLRRHRQTMKDRTLRQLEWLGQHLLDPVLEDTAAGQIHVTPYGPLFRVPFHALAWHGKSLIQRAQVSLNPVAGWSAPSPDRSRMGAVVIGHDGANGGHIQREARTAAAVLRASGVPVELLVDDYARSDKLRAAAPTAALIHLAGHAVYRMEHPEFSAIRLHDRWVTASDMSALPLQGACVILSACETGPRGAVGGREMLGLVRGLMRASASAVVASLWRVDDRKTRDFMNDLYSSWRTRGALGTALQDVQKRHECLGLDPYLWAPFCLIGRPDSPWPGNAVEEP